MRKPLSWLLVALIVSLPLAAGADEPGKLEYRGAEKRLEDLEKKVVRLRGQAFPLTHTDKDALSRIWALKEKFPDHPGVEEMFQRAKVAVRASKGSGMDLPANALAYRQNEARLKTMFAEIADASWTAMREQLDTEGGALLDPWPPPDQNEVPLDDILGKTVILEDFLYPMNEFTELGRQMVFVGSRARGFYFVELSNRSWIGAYEAFKRYRRFVNRDVPEGQPWTLVGKITGLEMFVPQAGEVKTLAAHWGWTVEPIALWLDGCTLATADPKLERGGFFAGEEKMEDVKSSLYTVTSIPDDVTPEGLTEIYITAIKEKNFPLYLDCIDPRRRETPKGIDLITYHWDWHQHRFASFYCHVEVGAATIRTLKGFDATDEDDIALKFLDPEEIEEIKKRAGQLVKGADLRTTAYDENGRQYGSPKPRFFRRVADGRWYIINYAQPF